VSAGRATGARVAGRAGGARVAGRAGGARVAGRAGGARVLWVLCALAAACFAPRAQADCFDDAAAWQHLNPLILRAIAWQESHNRADATHENANGSIDYGVMQINSIHLPELAQYGIRRDALMVPCKNVYIAAWHLRKQVVRYGNTWTAVGAYHSATPALRDDYARRIAAIIGRWQRDPSLIAQVSAAPLSAADVHVAQSGAARAGAAQANRTQTGAAQAESGQAGAAQAGSAQTGGAQLSSR